MKKSLLTLSITACALTLLAGCQQTPTPQQIRQQQSMYAAGTMAQNINSVAQYQAIDQVRVDRELAKKEAREQAIEQYQTALRDYELKMKELDLKLRTAQVDQDIALGNLNVQRASAQTKYSVAADQARTQAAREQIKLEMDLLRAKIERLRQSP